MNKFRNIFDLEDEETLAPEGLNVDEVLPSEGEEQPLTSPDSTIDNQEFLDETDDSDDMGREEAEARTPDESIKDASNDLLASVPDADKVDEGPAPQSSSMSPLERYKSYMEQYKKLQDQQRKGDLVNGLIAAGGKIGQSAAGRYSGNFNPDQAGNQMLAKMNDRPVQQFEQGQIVQNRGLELQANVNSHDPASPQSRLVREYVKTKLGLNLADDVSAADAQMLLKTVGKPGATHYQQMPMVNQQTGEKIMGSFNPTTNTFQDTAGNILDSRTWVRDYRAQSFIDPKTGERLGFGAGTGKVTGPLTGPGVNAPIVPQKPGDLSSNKPIEINRSFLTAQQAKQVDHAREKYIQEVRDDRNSLNANDRVISVLQAGGELGDLPREIQDQLNRAFGQKGHISDAQLGGLLGKADWKNRVENAVSLGMNGHLTDENRQFLLEVASLIKDQNESYIDKKSKIYADNLYNDLKSSPNLQKYKFGPESMRNLLGVESAVHPAGAPDSNMVQVVSTKSGKSFMLPKDKVKEALKKKLIEPLQEQQSQAAPMPEPEREPASNEEETDTEE